MAAHRQTISRKRSNITTRGFETFQSRTRLLGRQLASLGDLPDIVLHLVGDMNLVLGDDVKEIPARVPVELRPETVHCRQRDRGLSLYRADGAFGGDGFISQRFHFLLFHILVFLINQRVDIQLVGGGFRRFDGRAALVDLAESHEVI